MQGSHLVEGPWNGQDLAIHCVAVVQPEGLGHHAAEQQFVEPLSTDGRAIARQDHAPTGGHLDDADIERSTAEVEHEQESLLLMLYGERGGWFVGEGQLLEARELRS